MKDEVSINTVRNLRGRVELESFAKQLSNWVAQRTGDEAPSLTESRAKALLRVTELLDEATLNDFANYLEQDAFVRVALYDLLKETWLAKEVEVRGLARAHTVASKAPVSWLSLAVAAFAWRSGYPVQQLDPASPPAANTPAGQLLRRAAQYVRRQVQRSATERDKLNRLLSQPPTGAPTLDELHQAEQTAAPLPPHYRPPVPETYPEVASETLHIEADEIDAQPKITVGDPVVISAAELDSERAASTDPLPMPPITIERDQVAGSSTLPSPMPASAVVMPSSTMPPQPRTSLTVSLRQMFRQEELTSTKLRVVIQRYPDGPGLYGLQVKVSCKGIKSYVAGTTDREGRFACELPVRAQSGLTYDVDVTWPREEGGETERKSITLHADRTHFVLPFYRDLNPPEEG